MPDGSNRGLALLFGLLSALLLVVAGIVAFVGGFISLAFGFGSIALGAWARSVVYVVVGLVVGLFTGVGHSGDRDRTAACGAVLIVVAVVGWFGLGFGGELLALLASLFCLIAGVLYLVSGR
ncbi:MAG TPA: hypothetical protein VEH28_06510 [Thermoplasmata archaeon]|nr:hypothetical protein [Thermoplasmata archaeon]